MPDIARTRGERPMEDRMAVVRDSVAAGSLLLELLELKLKDCLIEGDVLEFVW